jgi:hypothetical protein
MPEVMSRTQYVAIAIIMFLLGTVVMVDLYLLYAPFQAAVLVVAPFLAVTAIFTIGLCALLMAAGAPSREALDAELGYEEGSDQFES